MPLLVRPATPADLATVVEFNERLAEETEGKRLDRRVLSSGVAAALADPSRARYFLAEEYGRAVGQIMFTTEWSDWRNGWIWWIQSVYVRAEARRRGVFTALYDHIHQNAVNDSEVVGLRLYVERENHAAQQTYLRMGMDRTSYLILERYPLTR